MVKDVGHVFVGLISLVLVFTLIIGISNSSNTNELPTGNFVTGWSAGGCVEKNVCNSNGDVVKYCAKTLVADCQYGCTTGVCNPAPLNDSGECIINPNEKILQRISCGSEFVDSLKQITVPSFNSTDECIPGNLTLERRCTVQVKFPSDSNSSLSSIIVDVNTANVCAKSGDKILQNFSVGEIEGILIESCTDIFWQIKT